MAAYLKKFDEKITIRTEALGESMLSGNGKVISGSILNTYMIKRTEIVLKSTQTPDGVTSDFFDSAQKQTARLSPNSELEIYPNSTLIIERFFSGEEGIKPIGGLILK